MGTGKALGNDGIIALSIDDIGPGIARIVNDLLLACYGPRFAVELRTQTQLANGSVKEDFEVIVHDSESSDSKEVGVMSGGERVWINEALARGVALYRAQHSAQGIQTLFTDEADGPLDPAKKRQYMRMKREVMRLGGYKWEYFISQNPESWAEAHAVIDVVSLAAANRPVALAA